MADINNFSDINDNFDTIKALLNSIRAQGILNTSDVDKLLGGINSKLEKINTEEDIDLIKAFLSELKKNLDERHEVLVSKFGAVESLFSNLLKNSTETVKSGELKEYFDIVATNLSVFSREVVSHKETLGDIILRLDAIQSDESQKKDIIKSVSTVRNDIEKLSNGFDSIVISLNENFKTVLKTVAEIDQSDAIKGFAEQLTDIINSSNTILSAIQVIDKKNDQFENAFDGLAKQEDTSSIQKAIVDLSLRSQEIANLVDTLTQKSYKIDNLSEKIDAAVNVIAGLKADISEQDNDTKSALLDRLTQLETVVREVSSDEEFNSFKSSLEAFLTDISSSSEQLKTSLSEALTNISKMNEDLKALDINTSFKNVSSDIAHSGEDVKEKIVAETDKLTQLLDVNITRTINDISSNTEFLNSRLNDSHAAITSLCEKSFTEVSENISGLKEIVNQLDENNVSANNAIFSNITDRLAIFENSLKNSLEKQEDYVSTSSNTVIEQILGMKKISEDIDYKLDSSSMELTNSRREYKELKESVDNMLALDFVNTVKDLKVDLYAAKQDLANAVDSSSGELSERLTNDLFGKYELLISKLDSVEDEIKFAQADALNSIKTVITNISDSIVDILSYVSVAKENNNASLEAKLTAVTESLKDSNLNYVENVRDVVDVIRVQIEENLKILSTESDGRFSRIREAISEGNQSVKEDLQKSYEKLKDVSAGFEELKEIVNVNNLTMTTNISDVLSASESIKNDFESKIGTLKNNLLDKINEFKKEFTCLNADNLSELKFNSENMYSRAVQQSVEFKNELKTELDSIIEALRTNISNLNENIEATALKMEGANKEVVGYIKNDFTREVNNSVDSIKTSTADVLSEIEVKVSDVISGFNALESSVTSLSTDTTTALSSTLAKILENFVALQSFVKSVSEKTNENIDSHLEHQTSLIDKNYSSLENLINALDEQSRESFRTAVEELNIEFSVLKRKFTEIDSAIDEDLARQVSIIEGNFESLNLMLVDIMNQATDSLGEKIKKELSGASSAMSEALAEELEQYKTQIEELYAELKNQNGEQADFIKTTIIELNNILEDALVKQNNASAIQLREISDNLKEALSKNIELTSADYETLKIKIEEFYKKITNNNDGMIEAIRAQLDDITKFMDNNLQIQSEEINACFQDIALGIKKLNLDITDFNNEQRDKISSVADSIGSLKEELISNSDEKSGSIVDSLTSVIKDFSESSTEITGEKLATIRTLIETSSTLSQNRTGEKAKEILDELESIHSQQIEHDKQIKQIFESEIKTELAALDKNLQVMFEENAVNFATQLSNTNSQLTEQVYAGITEFKTAFEELNKKIDEESISRTNLYQSQISELMSTFNKLTEETRELTKTEIASISEALSMSNKEGLEDFGQSIENKLDNILSNSAELSAGELQTIESFADKILEQVESVKQNSIVCKDLISNLLSEHFAQIEKNIEKETDVIVGDIIEQFGMMKDSQKDELSSLTSAIEGSVAGYIIDAVNDVKSYLDIKTDSTVLNGKLDTLRKELEQSAEETTENINKLLEVSVFNDAITDLRATNQVLIDSMADKLNNKIQDFVRENVSKRFEEKLNLFDKKFTDTVVDKYEEVKILTGQYNKSFEKIATSVEELISKFTDSKNEVHGCIEILISGVNKSVDELRLNFAELKAQIMNKSFDEAFHEAVHNQISGIENLVTEQLGYIEDISELCCSNLPELTEMNTIVKHGIQKSVKDIIEKIENQDINIPKELNQLKSDIITQFLNIFNQISFVAEQEEIIDFIQEKHSELITILSHIVTTADGVETVKDNLAVVDNKIDSLKEDIDLINEKITSIMSAEGDIDYVYSLQDLESDIANLRLVLNEMKADNKSEEFEELLSSTNNIYGLVAAIKAEMPKFEAEEFKKDFANLSEDIVSISTRTNKLLLSSDESYKTLQDNLQDFKLVINDLDERTRNFSKESGMDRIDNKLAALNTMMQNGAKTNQVFNQVFEYLAEWVDKAGSQIAAITEKVETLDDISQIKIMLEDLRAESQDNTESAELVEALGNIFDKQAKRIASLEAKLDRMIVDSTINSKTNHVDISPIEDTLNKFLVAMDDRMLLQQTKINSLEEKLEEVVSLVDNKETAQLTKKVGGMDKQLAKLNKSIEKIASNVVEK